MFTSMRIWRSLFAALLVAGVAFLASSLTVSARAFPANDSPWTADDRPTTVTDADGRFRFEHLERGTHEIFLDPYTLPAAHARQVAIWINPGQVLVSASIGPGVRIQAHYEQGGTVISGVVFWDRNGNGRQDADEPGLSGVTVIDPTSHQYFVPFDDQDLIVMLEASDVCQPSPSTFPEEVGTVLDSNISLTASSDGTVYYYDHWEDGYDVDPLTPGPTTEVGNLDAGQVRIFADQIDTADPAWGTTLYYDGRDRITVIGEEATVIRAAFPASAIGTRLAGAWEVEEAAIWGTDYVIPAGEDWGAGTDFEFTAATVTALQDGTEVYLNGALVATLSVGEAHFFPGVGDGTGLNSGDTITATAPIQVHTYSSICESGVNNYWSGNGYLLEPTDLWNSDYWSPVPNRSAAVCTNGNNAATDIFFYNPNSAAITVTIDDGAPTPVALPPGSSSAVALLGRALSDLQGVHIFAPGGEMFWGVVNLDTNRWVHEWGYSLIPENELSSIVVLGWAPGSGHNPPSAQFPPNGNLAWVTPVTDTVIFADFDRDGLADDIDCNGDGDALDAGACNGLSEVGSQNGITLTQGSFLRVADPTDANMTGALIFTRDLGQKIAVAWGQDPCVANTGNPYLDMGYTVLPIAVPSVSKFDTLAQDVDGSGDISPGDILTYTIVINNSGFGPMNNVVMTDALPYTHTDFIVGSIASTLPFTLDQYFDGAAWTYTPVGSGPFNTDPNVQQFRLFWPQIAGQEVVTVTFRVQIEAVDPSVTQVSNLAVVSSDNTEPRDSEDPDDPDDPDTDTPLGQPILWLNKLPSDPGTVAPGEMLTYTVVVSNVGTATALSALVVDNLPAWLTYEPNTLDLTWPVARVVTTTTPISVVTGLFTHTIGDDFDLPDRSGDTDFAGSDGSLPWLADWTEINDGGAGPDAGDVRVNTGVAASDPAFLNLHDGSENGDSGARRCADLTGFTAPALSYNMRGAVANPLTATYRVEVTGTTTLTTVLFSESYASVDLDYVSRYVDLSPFANDLQVCVTFFAEAGMTGFGEFYRIDNVFIYNDPPEIWGTSSLVHETTFIDYRSVSNTDPLTYTRILPDPTTAAITHTMHVTDVFPFPAQSRLTLTFQVRVGYPLTDGLVMVNNATITATNLVTTPYPLTDDEPTLIASNHALTITKADDPDPVFPGALLTYTLFWEVGGLEPAPNVVVTDVLPLPYVSFVSCAPLSECQGETAPGSGVVLWNLGDRLPPMSGITYESGTLTVTVRVDQRPPGGVFTNTVFIGDDDPGTPGDRDDEPTTVPDASYTLSKQRITPSPVAVDDPVQFLIVITNTGALTITRLPLQDTYDPVYLSFQSATPTEDAFTPGTITWNDLTTFAGDLAPAGTTQVLVEFTALTSTQHLTPPVTINTAVSDGAETVAGVLPRQVDSADVEIEEGTPTAIELLYLRARPKEGGVLVEWATLFEIDTYGFWLYRSTDIHLDHAEAVAFVPAKGWFGLGATYAYWDQNLPTGLYYYWLVEVENDGDETAYGPVGAWAGWQDAAPPYRIYLPLVQRP